MTRRFLERVWVAGRFHHGHPARFRTVNTQLKPFKETLDYIDHTPKQSTLGLACFDPNRALRRLAFDCNFGKKQVYWLLLEDNLSLPSLR